MERFEIGKNYIFKKDLLLEDMENVIDTDDVVPWIGILDNRMFVAKLEESNYLDGRMIFREWCEEIIF